MGRPIEIRIDTQERGAVAGLGRVENALSDVDNSLSDLERAGGDAERALEDVSDAGKDLAKIDGDAKDAAGGLEKLERAAKDAGDEGKTISRDLTEGLQDVEKAAREASAAVGSDFTTDLDAGMGRAGEVTEEFKDEARSNFSEVASSFSGDMDSAIDLVQGTLGGLAGSIPGGIGLALGGLGAAAGLFYNQWKENTEKSEERVQGMYDAMLESGKKFLTESQIMDAIEEISGDPGKYKEAQQIAEETGATIGSVLRSLAGDAEAAIPIEDALTAKIREQKDARDAAAEASLQADNGADRARYDEEVLALDASIDSLESYQGTLSATSEARQKASDLADAYNDARRGDAETARELAAAELDHADAVAAATEARDESTEVSNEERAALLDLADSYLTTTDAARANGENATQVTARQREMAASFVQAAQDMGYTADEANALAREYGLIPDDATTTINTPGMGDARSQTQGLTGDVNAVPDDATTTFSNNADDAAQRTRDYTEDVGNVPTSVTTEIKVTVPSITGMLQAAANQAAREITPPTITPRVVPGRVREV